MLPLMLQTTHLPLLQPPDLCLRCRDAEQLKSAEELQHIPSSSHIPLTSHVCSFPGALLFILPCAQVFSLFAQLCAAVSVSVPAG